MFCSRKRMLKLERGEGVLFSPWHPPLGLLFLLSLIFLRHNKDGGYNSTNINTQLSPAQNTPALQASTMYLSVRGCARNWVEISSPPKPFHSETRHNTDPVSGYIHTIPDDFSWPYEQQHQSLTHIENRGGAIWPIGCMH